MSKHDAANGSAQAASNAADAVQAVSTSAAGPMMFSDLVKVANGFISMLFSSRMLVDLLATLFTWITHLFSRHNSLIFALPLTAGLLLAVENALLGQPSWTLVWAAMIGGAGLAMYRRIDSS